MAWWLRAPAVLAEDPHLVPSTHIRWLQGTDVFGLTGHLRSCAHVHMSTFKHPHNQNSKQKFKSWEEGFQREIPSNNQTKFTLLICYVKQEWLGEDGNRTLKIKTLQEERQQAARKHLHMCQILWCHLWVENPEEILIALHIDTEAHIPTSSI